MTAEETLHQQPHEGGPLQKVPRLEGAVNFALWQARLKSALDEIDQAYWAVLQATNVPYDGIIRPIPARAEIITHLNKMIGNGLEPVHQDRVDAYIEEHYLKPNGTIQIWLAKDDQVKSLLMGTLEGHVQARVAHTKHAYEAYKIIKNLYRAIAPNLLSMWTTWINCVFEHGDTPENFASKWNAALRDLIDNFGRDIVSPRAQVFQFITAVTRQHEEMRDWIRHLRVDLDAPDALDRVCEDFLMDQGHRVDPDYFSYF